MGEMAADVVDRAGAQHERYIELMVTFQGGAVTTLGKQLRWTGDMADFHRRLLAAGLPSLLPKARADIDAGEMRMRALYALRHTAGATRLLGDGALAGSGDTHQSARRGVRADAVYRAC